MTIGPNFAETLCIRPMTPEDIPAVYAIEVPSFGEFHWLPSTFERELANPISRFRVICAPDGTVWGYQGTWCHQQEWHFNIAAAHPDHRQKGLGELMIASGLAAASQQGILVVTGEIRVSNTASQMMCYKYGFRVVSVRPRYYLDTDEDALVVSTGDLQTEASQAQLARALKALRQRYGGLPQGFGE
jgi:ribosomal-protein-alanine N-acetyltransferase